MKTKRLISCAVSVVALPTGLYAQNQKTTSSTQPNIIYILADDLGYGDLGCYGQSKFQTPNIDTLAKNGLKFTNHYSGCAVSAPARCALMTGLHTGHAPIRGNASQIIDGETFDTPLAASYKTVAECLKDAGYATACVGKWGLGGPGTQGHPNNQGFDYFYGHLGQGHAHFYYPRFMYENSQKITLNTNPAEKQYYAQDLFMDKATQFITDNKENPFFLYFAVTIPHAEMIVPDEALEEFKGLYPEPNPWPAGQHYAGDHGGQPYPRAAFAAMVTRLDKDVGRIMKLLKDLGIDDNTLVIFTSDNGPHQEGGGDPSFFNSSGGLRGIKRDLYEGGVRMPMIAHWPKVTQPGSVTDQPSAFWDVLPTFCEIANVSVPQGFDGISFLSDLKGKPRTASHEYFYWEFHETPSQAVRKDNWKAVRKNVTTIPIIELYDLSTDLAETNNLAKDNPTLVAELKKLMILSHTNETQWKFPVESIEDVEDSTAFDILVPVISGQANQFNPGQGIENSFDGIIDKPFYHSPWSGATTFPVVLEYFFIDSTKTPYSYPEQIDYFVYYPRTDGSTNGNFGNFKLYTLQKGQTSYALYGDYDFKQSSKKLKVAFDEGLKNPAAIKFEVLSGGNNFVSCAQMEFYQRSQSSANQYLKGAEALVKFYPNPAKEVLFIEGVNLQKIEIFTTLGALVKFQTNNLHQINILDLKSGVYILKIHLYSGEVVNGRFIVTR